ncbi:MAG: RNA 2',3'-cyclic phosphodiesterase [Legionella sp.]|uniref:RNA 2',3'-cyclic phosphodiesterase n=1 Tax=Legionella sp. TaxID=459 RepID=UPI00284093C8|nr:RNA 2',3'-cyclic phosphodiesterase [Legionella sp.]
MNTVRVFFAIRPPKSIHEPLRRILELARPVFPKKTLRWIGLENLHCTLQFINAIPQEQIAVLIERATILVKNQPSFWLHLGPLEWFPSLDHPKILSLSVEPQKTLKQLSECINPILVELGCSVETRPFRGHMSMGRVQRHNLSQGWIKQIKNTTISPVLIDKIYLIESRPAQGGRLYCTLAEFNLA